MSTRKPSNGGGNKPKNPAGSTRPVGKPNKATIQKQQAAKRAMAAASGARAERRRRLMMVLGPIAVVIVVIGIFVGVKAATGGKKANTATTADQTVAAAVTSVPAAVYDKVGKQNVSGPKALTGAPLTENGKPKVLYVGADWCPYCGAERWALATALSRFGTLSHIGQTSSSSTDYAPNTATLSFGKDFTYSSDYITGAIKDIQDGAGKPLDKLTSAENALWLSLTDNQGSFPFIDIGGKYQFSAQYDPISLKGLSQKQIAAQLSDPNSKVGKEIIGSANVLTAAICDVTNGKPASVCTSKAVTAAKPLLGANSNLSKEQSKATAGAGG